MQIHQLTQGSPEWIAYRTQHFNASDAPAMMGCSPYKTRSQLLHELATGQAAEVDAGTQHRFDDGHRFEALARPIAEEIMGEDLYPVVGSDGELSASFDGLTMAETRSAEHKSLNDEIRAALPHQGRDSHLYNDATKLGKVYRVQMEQQLMVSKAEENLFSATKWDGTKLLEERHAWYRSDPALRAEILAGWAQFKQDLAAYVPPEVIVPAVAAPQMGLPAVAIQVTGSIALVDNLEKFGTALTAYIERINKKPETDQDFADLEATVKTLKTAEDALDAAEAGALAQTDSIDAMRRTVGLYRDTARTNRLLIEKLVKAEKENRRTAIVGDAAAELVTHVKKLNERLGKPYMPTITADFQGVIKGLKSLDSMKDKVATELARCKIAANEAADRIQANLTTLRELASEHAFLFADAGTLVGKANDDLTALVKSRIADHKAAEAAKEEATRAAIRAEEQAKAARAVQIQGRIDAFAVAGEPLDVRTADEIASIIRTVSATVLSADLLDDRVTDAQAAKDAALKRLNDAFYAASQKVSGADEAARASVVLSEKPEADQNANAFVDRIEQQTAPALTHTQVVQQMPATVRQAMAPKPAAKPETPPTLTLGEISTRLGFNCTSAFLATLGFEAVPVKASRLYHEADFPAICAALIAHISEVQDQFEPATA
jgi:putative phage-type endonuclease